MKNTSVLGRDAVGEFGGEIDWDPLRVGDNGGGLGSSRLSSGEFSDLTFKGGKGIGREPWEKDGRRSSTVDVLVSFLPDSAGGLVGANADIHKGCLKWVWALNTCVSTVSEPLESIDVRSDWTLVRVNTWSFFSASAVDHMHKVSFDK
jgi:hypothetical protein